jgi:glutamyl-tRNA reductase
MKPDSARPPSCIGRTCGSQSACSRLLARTSHDVTVTVRTLTEVRLLADQVAGAADALRDAMTAALGPDWVLVGDQLRQELGHDISADAGT